MNLKIPIGEKKLLITAVALCAALLVLLVCVFRKTIKHTVMIFENYVTENKEAFLQKVHSICGSLGIKGDWLMAVMAMESRLNHRAVNPTGGATGLIQFMPKTANALGTTCDALCAMTNVQQLDYVYKYLNTYKGKMNCFTDVYLAVFYPAAMGKAESYIIAAPGSKVAQQNAIFQDATGAITVGSFKNYITKWVAQKGYTLA
ncbi:MAG: transglycosylase SLT domain-containing protein [Bacteroidales bacterium]|jgi:hypothetical protein|nr:transglycosylase SLT domain-containing protein [Bacteroidales bacterium]